MFWEKGFLIRELIIGFHKRPNISLLMTLTKLQHQLKPFSWKKFVAGANSDNELAKSRQNLISLEMSDISIAEREAGFCLHSVGILCTFCGF